MKRLLLAVSCATVCAPAFAYVDPNTGGWLYQLIFPLLIAAAASWRYMKQRIGLFFGRLLGQKVAKAAKAAKADDRTGDRGAHHG